MPRGVTYRVTHIDTKRTKIFSATEIRSRQHPARRSPARFPGTNRNVCATATTAKKPPARFLGTLRPGQNDSLCVAEARTLSQYPSPGPRFPLALSYSARLLSDIFRGAYRPALGL